jgi:hypothetical protein
MGQVHFFQPRAATRPDAEPLVSVKFTVLELVKVVGMYLWFKGFEKAGGLNGFFFTSVLLHP